MDRQPLAFRLTTTENTGFPVCPTCVVLDFGWRTYRESIKTKVLWPPAVSSPQPSHLLFAGLCGVRCALSRVVLWSHFQANRAASHRRQQFATVFHGGTRHFYQYSFNHYGLHDICELTTFLAAKGEFCFITWVLILWRILIHERVYFRGFSF